MKKYNLDFVTYGKARSSGFGPQASFSLARIAAFKPKMKKTRKKH